MILWLNNDNLWIFCGSFLIWGFDFGEFFGFMCDQVEIVIRIILDDEIFFDLQVFINMGQIYFVGVYVSFLVFFFVEMWQE